MVQHHPALNRPTAPVCSVCIANYNGAHMLAECLDSILAQDADVTVEIIIHDDASTDDSVAFLRAHYPQVELLASTENVGFCISNNRMVAHARGRYALLLNNDAALQPDALATLLAEARRSSKPGILTLPQYDWQSGELVDRGSLLDPFYNPVPNLDPSRRNVAMVIGACLWIARDQWNELGGFPEWMGSIGEDLYLCCIARLNGLPVQVTSRSGYRHRQGASFGGNRENAAGLCTTYRRRALSERNKTSVMVLCTPTPLVWPLLLLHGMFLAVEGLLIALFRRNWRIWREIYRAALGYLWDNFSVLYTRRTHIQCTRRTTLCVYFRDFVWVPRKLVLLWKHGIPAIR